MPATTRDDQLRHAAETRGTVTILCHECEEEVASAARAVGQDLGIEPGIDRAPGEPCEASS